MAQLNNLPMFFLGALSKDGFASEFCDVFNPFDGWKAYILKGGPGTGKSTLMKRIASIAADGGERVMLAPCSSDPDSLDAVVLPDRKCAVMDGTAPHVVEPKYPILCEELINLGEYADPSVLREHRQEVFAAYEQNTAYWHRAGRYVAAAGQLLSDAYSAALACTDTEKAQRAARSLAKEYLPSSTNRDGSRMRCRLRAVTPLGMLFYKNTPEKICSSTVVICDEFGPSANTVLSYLEKEALGRGCKVISALDPVFPGNRIDALMLPEQGVAFCTENRYMHPKTDCRHIHSRRFTDVAELRRHRQRMNFNKKAADEMLSEAAVSMVAANRAHEAIEEFYVQSMNFEMINAVGDRLINKIFG